jgi:cysteine-rich repeat protein
LFNMNCSEKLLYILVVAGTALFIPYSAGAVCGDGIIEYLTEQCDDGNLNSGDRCSSACQSEDGSHLVPQCGNGKIEGEEQCDGEGDACSTSCKLQISTDSTVDISACGTYSQKNTLYRITQDLSSADDCLVFTQGDIIVDGQNHKITAGGRGIYLQEWNQRNFIVKNVRVDTTGPTGIGGRTIQNALVSNVWVVNKASTDQINGANNIDFSESSRIVLENCFLENHLTDVLNRHQYSGASVKLGTGGVVRRCIFKGTPQNAVAPGTDSHIFNNYANGGTEIEPGSASEGYTNNFFAVCWNQKDVTLNNNVVVNAGYWAADYTMQGASLEQIIGTDLPYLLSYHLRGDVLQRPLKIIHGRPQNRGLFGEDGNTAVSGIKLYNNYGSNYVPPNNDEYEGCQAGGATGIQLESVVEGSRVFDNKLAAIAGECYANALKPSSRHDSNNNPNIWEGNDIALIKVEKGSGPSLEIDAWLNRAAAFHARESIPGNIFRNNKVTTLVIDQNGNSLEDANTGGNDVTLWQLGHYSEADGFTMEGTLIDLRRTPGQKYLSVSRTWNGETQSNQPDSQTIIWKDTEFFDSQSLQLFLDNITSVYQGWALDAGGSDVVLPQVAVLVQGTSIVEEDPDPAIPTNPDNLRVVSD